MSSRCDKKGCTRTATWGVYKFLWGVMKIDLRHPLKKYCGPHKPRWNLQQTVRNIKLAA